MNTLLLKHLLRTARLPRHAVLAAALALVATQPAWAGASDLKPFAPPKAGQGRWVIRLPEQVNEADWKLELIVGREATVDCNLHGLTGQIKQKTVSGWGYSYYELHGGDGPGFSTMMACPPGSERQAFVTAPPLLLRYNSQLPVVVYAPKNMSVRYRLWMPQNKTAADAVQE